LTQKPHCALCERDTAYPKAPPPVPPDPMASTNRVAYLAVADKYLGLLAVRLKGCDQPVIRTRNAFSTLHSTRLVGI
jgi:hypothetical protein